MSLKLTLTIEAKSRDELLDAVDAFTDEMFDKLGQDDTKAEEVQFTAADGDNWSYQVGIKKADRNSPPETPPSPPPSNKD